MRTPLSWRISLALILAASAVDGAENIPREMIRDNRFVNGFILWETKPGHHVRYGALNGLDSKQKPVWGLSQWSSKFPLDSSKLVKRPGGQLLCSNAAKAVVFGAGKSSLPDISMTVNSSVEYGEHARKTGDPWVHLLVEQEFDPHASLAKMNGAILHVEARLLRSRNLHQDDYSPAVHAAQFQIFFTVQNRNRQSPGYGDLLWLGVPIYDNRDRFPKQFQARDFGGTAKFIFTADGKTFSLESAHDGKWIVIDKNLLPLMREALETAWSRGFLKDSKQLADYYIGEMNMGWELPGTFDVEMHVRHLSLKVIPNDRAD